MGKHPCSPLSPSIACRAPPGTGQELTEEAGAAAASHSAAVQDGSMPQDSTLASQKEPCSLVVNNIRPTANEASLRLLFESAGHVLGCKLVKDEATGAHRGFGFVMMASVGEAEAAAQKFDNFKASS